MTKKQERERTSEDVAVDVAVKAREDAREALKTARKALRAALLSKDEGRIDLAYLEEQRAVKALRDADRQERSARVLRASSQSPLPF